MFVSKVISTVGCVNDNSAGWRGEDTKQIQDEMYTCGTIDIRLRDPLKSFQESLEGILNPALNLSPNAHFSLVPV